jgi:hypothetical protein
LQQRTPRFWKTKTGQEKTIKDLVTNIDSCTESIITYDNIDLDDTTLTLQPAPYIADRVDEHKDKIWNEFLRLVGISNLQYQKKERNIRDEITAMQGGTIASRYSRFEPRQKAVKQINEKFEKYLKEPIEVRYYDGLPTTLTDFEESIDFEESEDLDNE